MRESLIEPEQEYASNICYFGGTVLKQELFPLQRQLFRQTREKAMIYSFPIEIESSDVIKKDDFHLQRVGYFITFNDEKAHGSQLRKTVTRIVECYNGVRLETTKNSVNEELRNAIGQKD